MKAILPLAALLVAVAPRALAGTTVDGPPRVARDGEVRGVSVLPAAGKVEIVIDLQGAAVVQDFTLANPARLVIDLQGARLTAPAALYDGQNRGGVRNVRYAQFKPDVVRVVIDLDALKDYQVERAAGQVRVRIGTERTSFAAWSSSTVTPRASGAVASAAARAPIVTGGPEQAARVTTPSMGRSLSIEEYLAAHRADAAQSQAPRITVQWDNASIEDVVAGFAAFSGRTIILAKGITGNVTAEIKNQPWDLALNAVLESQGLSVQTLPGGILNVVSKVELARADSTVPITTRLVRINYARATSLVPSVQSILTKRGQAVADSTSNSLVITEVSSRIDDVVDFVKGLDLRTPQVSIQAKIIFVDRLDVEQLGVKYDLGSQNQFFNRLIQRPDPASAQPVDTDLDGVPDALVPTEFFDRNSDIVALGGNSLSAIGNASQEVVNPALELIFSTAIGNFDLTTFVQALQRVELADIQAEPTITTLDNRQAEILVGDRVPIRVIDVSAVSTGTGTGTPVPRATVQFQQTGINLRVTPHVTANRQILMEVHAERSSVRPAAVDIGFTFQTQQADNQILVNDGETAVIGGLTVTEVTVTKSGIPFLVDLPILGKLFGFTDQQESRRDLLILITPHIIDDLVAPTGQ
ncbi:MAG TPA: AMIN domain-containing protein [Gemmatimonadales bacterium]|jgi:type IV pilus assembly protein PilQ|nr:AMIN domain-containing protein [Gemmatimonadales bacterium]